MADLQKLIKKHLSEKEPDISKKFQTLAVSSGWDAQAAGGVNFSSSGMSITDTHRTTVEDLEYGDGHTPAKPAMRRFKPEYEQHLSEAVEEAIMEYLGVKK